MATGLTKDSIVSGGIALEGFKRDGLSVASLGVPAFSRFVKKSVTNTATIITNPYPVTAIRILAIYSKATNINYKLTGDFIDLTIIQAIQTFEFLIVGGGKSFTITPTQPLDSFMVVVQEINLVDSFDVAAL